MNRVFAQCLHNVKSMEESYNAEISLIREELGKVLRKLESTEKELSLCKKALVQGSPSMSEVRTTTSKMFHDPRLSKGQEMRRN